MEGQRIIKNINKNEFSNLLSDIQSLISHKKTDCSEMCKLLQAMLHVIPKIENDDKEDVFNFIPSINLCVDYIKESYSFYDIEKNNFFPIIYHIIRSFLKAQLYIPAMSYADIMKALLENPENFDDKSMYINNMRILFWNEAHHLEKVPESFDCELVLKLRQTSIHFLILDQSGPCSVYEYVNQSLIRYCQSNKHNTEVLENFLQNMWLKLQCLEDTYSHKALLYKMLYNWFEITSKYLKSTYFTNIFLRYFQDLTETNNRKKESKLLNACIGITNICFQFFILQEEATKFKKLCFQHIEYCKNRKELSNGEVQILAYTCCIFYSCFSKYFHYLKSLSEDHILEMKPALEICMSLVLFYIYILSEDQIQKISQHSFVLKFNVCSLLSTLFFKFIKKEQEDMEKRKLVKEAETFLKHSFSKLSEYSVSENTASKAVLGLVSIISSLGMSLYNIKFYAESCSILEIAENFFNLISSSPEFKSDENQDMLWKIHEILIYDCFLCGSHEKALNFIAKSLTIHEKKTKECFELWRKVKKDAIRNKKEYLLPSTIRDVLISNNIDVVLEKEIEYLTEELKICKSERHFEDEVVAVILKLLNMQCTYSIRAWVLLETVTLSAVVTEKVTSVLKNTPTDMCVESINLYQEYISENPADYAAKLYLSIAYFWLYHANLKRIHEIAEKETQSILKPKHPVPKKEPQNDVEEENDTCDIQPIHPLVCLSVEADTLKNLENAIILWIEIPTDVWGDLAHIIKDKNVLDVIQATAEIYSTAAHDLKEWKLWLLLHSVSVAVANKLYEFTACIALTNLLIRLGYLQIALYFLDIAQCNIQLCQNSDSEILKLKYCITKSNFLLHSGKFDEGLILLQEVLMNAAIEKRQKSVKLLCIEALLLQSEYMLLPCNAFMNSDNIEYLKVNSHLVPLLEAVGVCKVLLKHVSDKQASMFKELDWMCFMPALIRVLLKTHLQLSEFYFKAGDPRIARCYLQEALKIAESHILSFWSSKILLILCYIDFTCDNYKDCQVKISGLKYIFSKNEKQNAKEILNHLQEKYSSSDEPLSPDSPEFNLNIIPEISLKRHIKQCITDKVDVLSSPFCKQTKSNFSKNNKWEYSEDIFSLSLLQLESSFLSCILPQNGNNEDDSTDILLELLDQYDKLKILRKFDNELESLNLNFKESFSRTHSKSEVFLFSTMLFHLIKFYSLKNDIRNAKKVVSHAYNFLKDASCYPKYSYSEIYALIKYHDIRISLCECLKIPLLSSATFYVFPSFKSNISIKKTILEKTDQNVAPRTPVQTNIPKILLNDNSVNTKNCQAPLKRNLLNSNLKKDIEAHNIAESSKLVTSPFVIIDSSDEENFESPYDSFSRASRTRSNPKKGKKQTKNSEKSIVYQIFKSKNESLNVKNSSDVWNLPLAETPKRGKEKRKLRSCKKVIKTSQEGKKKSSSTSVKNKMKNAKVKSKTVINSSVESTNIIDESLKHSNSSFESSISERKISIEHSRCSPYDELKESNNFDVNSTVNVGNDLYDSVFFSPSSKKSKDIDVPNLLNSLCRNMNDLSLSRKESLGSISENLDKFIQDLEEARQLILNSMPYPLYPNICRLLAALKSIKISSAQPKNEEIMDCCFLLSESFSITLRNFYISNMLYFKDPEISKEKEVVINYIKKFNCDIQMRLLQAVPENWTILQVSSFHNEEYLPTSDDIPCPTKLIICQFRKNCIPLVVTSDCSTNENFSPGFLSDFKKILEESSLTMQNKDSKMWWNTRSSLNIKLKSFTHCMENIWLGCWKGLFLGLPQNAERIEVLRKTVDAITELPSTTDKKLLEVLIDSAQYLSKEQMLAAVSYLFNCSPQDAVNKKLYQQLKKFSITLPQTERHPVILILDQTLQMLPWECMPILKNVPVSRMPSLSILLCKLAMFDSESTLYHGIDTLDTYYILNPAGDLVKSQEYLQEKFERQRKWKGLCGIPPSPEEFVSAFKDYELFIYCGHGSGKKYFESSYIDKHRFQSVTILMGCSSGKLSRLGRILESNGLVLRLLLCGCPSIAANLWDVTDKDIDRFTDKLLQSFVPTYDELGSNTYDLAKATSVARNACKMTYLVGAAPVVYGFPVFPKM